MRPLPFVLALAALSAAFAVDTRFWTFASKEDHDKATLKRLSLRSDGRITLAPAAKELHDAGVSYLWAVARGADDFAPRFQQALKRIEQHRVVVGQENTRAVIHG